MSSYRTLLRVLFLHAVDLLLLMIDHFFDFGFVEAIDNGVFSRGNVDWDRWLVTWMMDKINALLLT